MILGETKAFNFHEVNASDDRRLDVDNAETFKQNEFMKACNAMGITREIKQNA